MNFRFRMTAWFGLALVGVFCVLAVSADIHLRTELLLKKNDDTHPAYADWSLHGRFADSEVQDIVGEMVNVWIWVGVPTLIVSLGVGFLLANRSLRPVRIITRSLAQMTTGTLKSGISPPEKDPILSELVSQINALLFRVGDSYSEMAEYSSRVAHELRTPLTLLRLRIEQASEEIPADLSEELQEELARLSRFVERSLMATQAESGRLDAHYEQVGISDMVEEMQEPYEILAAQGGLALAWNVAPGLQALSDRDLLRQILHNLLGNACRYGTSPGRLRAWRSGARTVLVLTNNYRPETRAVGGLGIGLRLVRSLTSSMQGHHFSFRDTGRIFSVRLVWKCPVG